MDPRASGQDRRRYPRIKVQVSLEVRTSDDSPPMRLATDEVSLCGCYAETSFTFELGTKVQITLWLNEQPIRTTAIVATRYPQLGNGFDFINMSPEDRSKLNEFISALPQSQDLRH